MGKRLLGDHPFQINSVTLPLFNADYLQEHPDWISVDAMVDYIVSIGATDVRIIPTLGMMDDPDNNVINLNAGYTPPKAEIADLCAKLTAAGIGIEIAPFIPMTTDAILSGSGRITPTDPELFMQNLSAAMLDWAEFAQSVGAERLTVIQDDTQHLTYGNYPELVDNWLQLFADIRQVFSGDLTTMLYVDGSIFGPDGIIARDGSFSDSRPSQLQLTDRRIIEALDILGVGAITDPLTNSMDPTVDELVNSFYNNVNGLNVVEFLRNIHEYYGLPIYLSDRPFHSFDGSNVNHIQIFDDNPLVVDEQEQADLYEAFFRVWTQEQADWMLGVSFQNVNRSPYGTYPRYADSEFGENFQGKLAESVLSAWYNGLRQGTGLTYNGTAGPDRLVGGYHHDTIRGGAGNDTLQGGKGNDAISGNDGNDLLQGDEGDDTLGGGAGIDTASYTSSPKRVTVSLAIADPQNTNGAGLDKLTGIENLKGSSFNDRLTGSAAANKLDGWLGADAMLGLAGNDTYVVDNTGDRVYETTTTTSGLDAGGSDTVQSSISLNLGAYAGIRFVEKLTLTGTANINGIGNALANTITGNSGANLLNGGAGNDTLNGGGGRDKIRFDAVLGASNVDTIKNFVTADDTIQLDNAIFTAFAATGTLLASQFVKGTAALDANDRIIFNSGTGALLYDADGSGPGGSIQFATIAGLTGTLTASDFVII